MTMYATHPRELPASEHLLLPMEDIAATDQWFLFSEARERQGTRPPGYVRRHEMPAERVIDWNRIITITLAATLSVLLLGYGLLMVLKASLPVAQCAPWTACLIAGGMALTLLIHAVAADPRQ